MREIFKLSYIKLFIMEQRLGAQNNPSMQPVTQGLRKLELNNSKYLKKREMSSLV